MPRFPACSGAPAVSPIKQATLSWPAMDEATGLGLTLPTSEPADPQVSYIIATGHLPTITGDFPPFRLAPVLMVGGVNTSGSSRAVSYRVLLNGTSITTGTISAFNNNIKYTLSAVSWGDGGAPPAVGDTVAFKVWASGSGVSLNVKALHMNLTQLGRGLSRRILCIPVLGSAVAYSLTATPPSWATASSADNVWSKPEGTNHFTQTQPQTQVVLVRSNFGIGRQAYGDYGATGAGAYVKPYMHTTSYNVYCDVRLTGITFFYAYMTP